MAETEPKLPGEPLTPSKEKNGTGIDAAKDVVAQGPEAKELTSDTKVKLKKLQETIRSGNINVQLTKNLLEGVKELDPQDKPFILAGIITALSHVGISIDGSKGEHISLKAGKQNLKQNLKIASFEETLNYQSLINSAIGQGYFSNKDVMTALLYRSSSLDTYINTKFDSQPTSTKEYVLRLLMKYQMPVELSLKNLDTALPDEKSYKSITTMVKEYVTNNPSDRDFLLAYFDDVYYSKGKNVSSITLDNYKKNSKELDENMKKAFNQLSDDQKFALGVRDSNEANELKKQWKNDAGTAALDMLKKGGAFGIVFALIGALISGKKGAGIGGVLGLLLGGGGTAIASEMMKNLGGAGEESTENKPEENLLYNKFKGIFGANSENQKEWKALSKNVNFLGVNASILNIFNEGKKEEDIISELNKAGIPITAANREKYNTIFQKLIDKKKSDAVGMPKEGEKMNDYLNRTKAEGSEKSTKTTKELISEVEGSKVIIPTLKLKYSNITVGNLEQMNNNPAKLESMIVITLGKPFYEQYGNSLKEMIALTVKNEPDKNKTIGEILA